MRIKITSLLLSILITPILLLTGYVLYGFYLGPELDDRRLALEPNAAKWANETIRATVTEWKQGDFYPLTSDEFRKNISLAEVEDMLLNFNAVLGSLVRYDAPTGKVIVVSNGIYETVGAQYTAEVQFENGTAEITLFGVMEEEQWRIKNFHISIKELKN